MQDENRQDVQDAEEGEERLDELGRGDGGAGREDNDEEEGQVEQAVAHQEGGPEEGEGRARRRVTQLCGCRGLGWCMVGGEVRHGGPIERAHLTRSFGRHLPAPRRG
jgi:hypothetical protein